MIVGTLLILLPPGNIRNFASPYLLPIEAILVSRLLLDLCELGHRNDNLTTSQVFTTLPLEADKAYTPNGASDSVQVDSDASHMMDVGPPFDNDPQGREYPGRAEVSVKELSEMEIDIYEACPRGTLTEI
ncbi:hypothetical protein K439DRAFT_1627576, partial [Ramaria rubella]